MNRCCETMDDAIEYGYLTVLNGEFLLPPRTLTEVNPDATAGNVLTGETYDPGEFSMSFMLAFCPWCRESLTPVRDDLSDSPVFDGPEPAVPTCIGPGTSG